MRPSRILPLLALALLSPFLGAPASAPPAGNEAQTPGIGITTYRALLIGISDYADPRVADLTSPVHDIQAVARVLQDRYGFETRALTGSDATRKGVLDALTALRRETRDSDAVLVYFAGHGTWDAPAQEGYWLPYDAAADSDATWVSNSDLAGRLRAMPARHVLLVSDACFSGSLFRDIGTASAVAPASDASVARRLAASRSREVITSGSNEPVTDQYREGLSVFAYFLVRALDAQTETWIPMDSVFHAVRDDVMNNARQTPRQGPFFETGDEGGQLVLWNRRARPTTTAPRATPTPPVSTAASQVDPSKALTDEDRILRRFGVRTVRIPAGTLWMGSGEADRQADREERPRHQVNLTRAFRMMDVEVNQSLFEAVSGRNPSHHAACGPSCPVEGVSWNEALDFANALSEAEGLEKCYTRGASDWEWPRGLDCRGYRLPTEAEWEYAARSNQATAWAGSDDAAEVAWISANSEARTHAGRGRLANAWGLFDLSGNVWEWVWDGYAPYTPVNASDPMGPPSAASRVLRGGSWLYDARRARAAWRHSAGPEARFPDVGFRLVRTAP